MERLITSRDTQTISIDDYINEIIDGGVCKYCDYYDFCSEYVGEDNIQEISGCGCSAFDAPIEKLKKCYLIEKCIPIGT